MTLRSSLDNVQTIKQILTSKKEEEEEEAKLTKQNTQMQFYVIEIFYFNQHFMFISILYWGLTCLIHVFYFSVFEDETN